MLNRHNFVQYCSLFLYNERGILDKIEIDNAFSIAVQMFVISVVGGEALENDQPKVMLFAPLA